MRFLPGVPFTGMWLNPNSRGSRLRIWQPWGCIAVRVSERRLLGHLTGKAWEAHSLHAHQPSLYHDKSEAATKKHIVRRTAPTSITPASAWRAFSRRLASAGKADPGDLKSPSLPGASPGSPTILRSSSHSSTTRRVVHKE